jgi:hypothetical protein
MKSEGDMASTRASRWDDRLPFAGRAPTAKKDGREPARRRGGSMKKTKAHEAEVAKSVADLKAQFKRVPPGRPDSSWETMRPLD